MARNATQYRCSACGAKPVKWTGRCARCGEFGTIAQEAAPAALSAGGQAPVKVSVPRQPAKPVTEVILAGPATRLSTDCPEFDRVVGGGLVPGQVLLLSGEPGAGKSTLLLTVANSVCATSGGSVLYVSGEESVEQIAVRARRIGANCPGLLLSDETELGAVIGLITDTAGLELVIVDSVQTIASAQVEGRAGGVAQVMAVAQSLTRVAKELGVPLCLVGQVTKESVVAGPRALEHVVDTTLSLDGDRHTSLRLLRTVKNRYGPADEVACFEQTDAGLEEVPDPSALFRSQNGQAGPGVCLTVTVEGRRPLLAEVQALTVASTVPNPRRGVSGLDSSRCAMLVAVSERTGRLRLGDKDLFLATVGGISLRDPAADLAVCLAVMSAAREVALPAGTGAIGEVTLAGEVRPVPMIAQRVAEGVRLGQQRILVPAGTAAKVARAHQRHVVEVGTLADAAAQVGLARAR
ncbi:DNA repair protein RadA [Buchananella felis]|uniref:DNA repair protein RadA n=1 Tax=Buchananella felis TaxID=3231492 RepID=UPI003526C9CA